MSARHLLLLPGVGGDANFWRPLGERLPGDWEKTYFGWPGLGANAPDPSVNSYDDLVAMVEARMGPAPVDLLAQSMGGAIALILALRQPKRIRRLVLAVTAGGMDVSAFGASDWRPEYRSEYPQAADWITNERPDVTARLSEVTQPTLLIWGDRDPISPVAIGKHLESRLCNASLHIIAGGEHDLIKTRPDEVAGLILSHLA